MPMLIIRAKAQLAVARIDTQWLTCLNISVWTVVMTPSISHRMRRTRLNSWSSCTAWSPNRLMRKISETFLQVSRRSAALQVFGTAAARCGTSSNASNHVLPALQGILKSEAMQQF